MPWVTLAPRVPAQSPFRESLEASWREGIGAAVMMAVIDYYLVPLGLHLGASPSRIGMLVALPHFAAALAQLWAVEAARALGDRRRFLVWGCAAQAALMLPMAALPLLDWPGRLWLLAGLVALWRAQGNFVGAVWGSVVSQYLAAQERGVYFAARSRVAGLAGVAGMALCALILFWSRGRSAALGFALVYAFGALARFASAVYMRRMREVPLPPSADADFTFWQFIRRMRESNFVRFVVYASGLTFLTHLAAPYFSVYMLQELGFSYPAYISVHLATVLASLFAMPLWGAHADHAGNARVVKLSGYLVIVPPFLWLVSARPLYLVGIELFSGFAWSAFTLCTVNFIYDAVRPDKRLRCLAYFVLFNGLAVSLGSLLGGFLAERLPPLWGSRLLALFALSGILRALWHLLLRRAFAEVREKARTLSSLELFFSVVGFRPLLGRATESATISVGSR